MPTFYSAIEETVYATFIATDETAFIPTVVFTIKTAIDATN